MKFTYMYFTLNYSRKCLQTFWKINCLRLTSVQDVKFSQCFGRLICLISWTTPFHSFFPLSKVLICCVKFWNLSQAEKKIIVVTSWANAQNGIYFSQNGRSVKIVPQLVTKVIFFLAWDKSRVKWDNSQNSTQKMRT